MHVDLLHTDRQIDMLQTRNNPTTDARMSLLQTGKMFMLQTDRHSRSQHFLHVRFGGVLTIRQVHRMAWMKNWPKRGLNLFPMYLYSASDNAGEVRI